VADFKSEWPSSNRNRGPTSFRNQWPACSGISTELGKALDRTTPAEIREIVATAIRLCVPQPGQDAPPPLDIAMIERARSSLKHMIATAEELADDTPEEREDLHGRLGPLDDDLPF
jgi:hypothetical protein